MNNYILFLTTYLLFCSFSHAAAKLPSFFSDNMVLQREKPVPIWGWAEPGEAVEVSFAGQTKQATANEDGKWMLRLDPMAANSQGQALAVNGGAISLQNIVIGDVWICSGQSNMEWTVRQSHDPAGESAKANFPLIRHMKVAHRHGPFRQQDVSSNWVPAQPNTVPHFTAVGYYFARRLHSELDVPIGLIGTNWGGTRIEPWTPPIGFQQVPELAHLSAEVDKADIETEAGRASYSQAFKDLSVWAGQAAALLDAGETKLPARPAMPDDGASHQSPTRIYNEMIHPLIPFAIRGAIWYQGESNGGEGDSYFQKKQALIGGWRELWGQGDFPFYFVQLASFTGANNNPAGGDGFARIREAQRKSLKIPNTGMAVIADIGHPSDIHPKNKQDVGSRLAQWALAKEYGQDLVPSGPLYKSMKVEGSAIRIEFDHIGAGLIAAHKEILKPYEPVKELAPDALKRFAIAGADKTWHWAEARIEGDSVVVSSPAVAAPVAVRYAYSGNPAGANLYNREGLPASPFRTDNW